MKSFHELEAVVLRQYPLSDADAIVVLLSKEMGKIRAVAKGAKRLKSRLGASLEPLNHVMLGVLLRPNQELGRITRGEVVRSYLSGNSNPEKIIVYEYISEIVIELVEDNSASPLLFRLLISSLDAFEKHGLREPLIRYFEFWTLKLAGVLPDYTYCSGCGACVNDTGFYARLDLGQARCEGCAGREGVSVSSGAALWLSRLATTSPTDMLILSWSANMARDLEALARRHLEWNLEKRLKSALQVRALYRSG